MTEPSKTPRTDAIAAKFKITVNTDECTCPQCSLHNLCRELEGSLSETVSKVREIHGVMKRGDATEDHGLAGNLSCILDSVCTYKEGAERRATEAHDHYQPQIDQCIRELNESSAYAGSSQRALRRIEQTLMQRLAANDAADNDWWDGAAMALCLVREERAAIGDKIETSLDLLQQATDDAHAERKCGVEGMPQPAGGHSKSGGSQNSPSSTNPVPEIVRCEHKWATDGLGPTQCVRCGEISGTTRSPAVGNPHDSLAAAVRLLNEFRIDHWDIDDHEFYWKGFGAARDVLMGEIADLERESSQVRVEKEADHGA